VRLAPDLVVIHETSVSDDLFESAALLLATAPRPVVVFTSDPDVDKMARALQMGIHAYATHGPAIPGGSRTYAPGDRATRRVRPTSAGREWSRPALRSSIIGRWGQPSSLLARVAALYEPQPVVKSQPVAAE
jgi:DNA-binding NarL/FixJ family response regulator